MDKSELMLKTTKELKDIAESGSNKIAVAMQEATKANYINFVSMLYHYSVPGEAQLNKAALALPTAEMRRLFSTMAEEEADHDIVAIKDIIERDRQHEESAMCLTPNIKGLVDYEQYMPEMARLIGCNVRLRHLINPFVLYKFWYGSHLPVIYRITGPGKIEKLPKKILRKLSVAYTIREQISLSIYFIRQKIFLRNKEGIGNIEREVVERD
ncbi:hypothetical protein [Vibrio ostreicida]|uniref:hypothetical protein n=1 Tax=Vibrio ostreicida TaxID=526588 RepID=UPI000970DD99|nr:hypothetical protein [Vibrio ostreicida]